MNKIFTAIEKEISLPKGFKTTGVHAGIKKSQKKDLALIFSDEEAHIAGVFTTNQVKAASVQLCQEKISGKKAKAVIINSGNANACTGPVGLSDAKRMCELTAELLHVNEKHVFVCSTGHIGVPLPMDLIEAGIHDTTEKLSSENGLLAAEAIMTTDTRPKYGTLKMQIDGQSVQLSAMAKGAGMIEPNMATMLAFFITDAAVDPEALQQGLSQAVNQSFNQITVDGDRSTNDTVLILANGLAKNHMLTPAHPQWIEFRDSLETLATFLALEIMHDAEGSTKTITVEVEEAINDQEANQAARSVANSLLVKTAWNGDKTNWGRIMAALGYSNATIKEHQIDIDINDKPAVRGGQICQTPEQELRDILAQNTFTINICLHVGKGSARIYTCDCSEEYVRINN